MCSVLMCDATYRRTYSLLTFHLMCNLFGAAIFKLCSMWYLVVCVLYFVLSAGGLLSFGITSNRYAIRNPQRLGEERRRREARWLCVCVVAH